MGGFVFNSETLVQIHIAIHNNPNDNEHEQLLDTHPLYYYSDCFLPTSLELNIEFQNFWNWIYQTYWAYAFTQATFEFFEYYHSTINLAEQANYFENLI